MDIKLSSKYDEVGNQKKPLNILIINIHSARNAGDAALVIMNVKQLRKAFGIHSRITLSVNYPEEEASLFETHDVDIVPSPFSFVRAGSSKNKILQVFRFLKLIFKSFLVKFLPGTMLVRFSNDPLFSFLISFYKTDIVAAVSGTQLLSMGRFGWPFILSISSIWLALFFNIPLYVLPQSIGPFRRGWEKFVVKNLYGRARIVFLRDAISLRLSKEIGLPEHCVKFAPDPGFALTPAPKSEATAILSNYGFNPLIPSIGVTLIGRIARTLSNYDLTRYYSDLGTVLFQFSEMINGRIYLFAQVTGPTHLEDDRNSAKKLLNYLPIGQSRVVSIEENLSPSLLKACYGNMNAFIASRLHSGIFAMSMGVPTLFFGHFTKTRGMMETLGLEEWVIEIGKSDYGDITNKINRLWQNREELRYTTIQKVTQLLPEIENTGFIIKDDYESIFSKN